MALLAQISPEAIGSWMQVLFYFAGGIGAILVGIRFFRPNPPEFKTDVNQLHGRVTGLRGELQKDLEKNAEKVEAAAAKMQDTFNTTVEKMGEMRGQLDAVDRRVSHLETKVDRHIERDSDR